MGNVVVENKDAPERIDRAKDANLTVFSAASMVMTISVYRAILLFVGRDGKVAKIHAGFASAASGECNNQLKAEFTSTIEQLLAQSSVAPVSAASLR